MKTVKIIDLGHDGFSNTSIECTEYATGERTWWFCRDGQRQRHIEESYLEGRMLEKILKLEKQLENALSSLP